MHDRRGERMPVFKVETGLIAAKRNTAQSNAILLQKFEAILVESNKFENAIFIPLCMLKGAILKVSL